MLISYIPPHVYSQDGTTLPDAGINATDPEGTAVSFSMSCQYLTINSTSGIVTMATSFDIDTAATYPYTIPCVVTATDATGQSSTATLDVIVSDSNDIAPVFTQVSFTLYMYEGEKVIFYFSIPHVTTQCNIPTGQLPILFTIL